MRKETWINADGLAVNFGTQDTKTIESGIIETTGRKGQLELEVYYDVDRTEVTTFDATLPADAVVTGGSMIVKEAFVGGTSVEFTLEDRDGGNSVTLITATAADLGEDEAQLIVEAGAKQHVGVERGVLYSTNGNFTAGRGTMLIEFVVPSA